MRMNCCGRFGFCGSNAIVGWRGQDVSFYTTFGGGVLLKDISAKGNSRSFILFK
jgi:hypothetical protein